MNKKIKSTKLDTKLKQIDKPEDEISLLIEEETESEENFTYSYTYTYTFKYFYS